MTPTTETLRELLQSAAYILSAASEGRSVMSAAGDLYRKIETALASPSIEGQAERKMVLEISFDPTNHHNALKCPYCNPDGLTLVKIKEPRVREPFVIEDDSPAIEGQAGGGVTRPVSDLPAVRLVDWAYLYATEGGSWPDQSTISEHLIALAERRAPTQADADMLKAGGTLKALLALDDADLPTANDVRGILGPAVSPQNCWTTQDLAEAKDEAKAMHEYFHPPVADRAAVIEELAQDFESSVHHVWDKDEVADRIRGIGGQAVSRAERGGVDV